MAKKKSKDKAENPPNDAVPAPPGDFFKTLFGHSLELDPATPSIFSDDNPFKRKPFQNSKTQPGPDPGPEPVEKVSNLESEDDLKKKRKRNKEERYNLKREEAPESALNNKNAKNLKTKNTNPGSDLGEPLEEDRENREKKKKKRKRDEVEREYEAKNYSLVSAEENKEKVEKLGGGAVVVGGKRKKADDEEAEAMVSKEGKDGDGFDDEDKLLRTVFVGNLPLKVKKKVVLREFGKFGEIESVRIRSIPIADTKIPRKGAIMLKKINETADSVHAYIVFKTQQSAEAALTHNMAEVGGNHIRVDRACPPRKKLKGSSSPLYDSKRTVFLGNLPFDVKDEEIYQLFSGIKGLESSVEGTRVVRDPHVGLGKGIAYLLFKSKEAADLAVKKRHLKIRDRELRISHAKQDSTPSKRRNPVSSNTDNSPTKKLAVNSRTAERKSMSNARGVMSYQGLRANKASGPQRTHLRKGAVKGKSNTQKGEQQKEKRPAVAARKAKARVLKDIGASKPTVKKRKLDSRTPDSSGQKRKKFRHGK